MERIFFSLENKVPPLTGGALLLGYFDGVHLGHQELISTAKSLSKKTGVLLFDQNLAVLLPNTGKSLKELTSLEDKLSLFEHFGVDFAYIIHTDLSFFSVCLDWINLGFLYLYCNPIFGKRQPEKGNFCR